MYPNRAENYCCTGGGGAMSMARVHARGASSRPRSRPISWPPPAPSVVVTSCHNCVDGLTDCIRHYKLGMQVTQLVNLVANAIVVPAKIAVPAVPAPAPAPMAELSLAGRRILVVDDEPDVLVFYTAVLQDQGATVFEASDGDAAIEIARREKPDLITLDLSMPGTDGGVVFETLRQDPELSAIKVCIITGRPELRRLIYDRAVRPPEGYLDKPVDEETLLRNVRKILDVTSVGIRRARGGRRWTCPTGTTSTRCRATSRCRTVTSRSSRPTGSSGRRSGTTAGATATRSTSTGPRSARSAPSNRPSTTARSTAAKSG